MSTEPLRPGKAGSASLTFLGAADTVTGSRYLVKIGGYTLLIDCGLFQGLKRLRLRNREPFAVPPADIDAVVLTHAHLDHSGYLPVLVRDGFEGPIYCTPPTRALAGLLLPDSAHLEVQAAERANRYDELMGWLDALGAPRQIFVTHGEPEASDALRRRIQNDLGWPACVPEHCAAVALG
jgi:Cft2 family RNA processing exonuclease